MAFNIVSGGGFGPSKKKVKPKVKFNIYGGGFKKPAPPFWNTKGTGGYKGPLGPGTSTVAPGTRTPDNRSERKGAPSRNPTPPRYGAPKTKRPVVVAGTKKKTVTPKRAPGGRSGSSAPPVASGSATGSASAAPGANVRTTASGGGGGSAAPASASGVDINKLYDPAFKALQSIRDRTTARQAEAQKNLQAFRDWQSGLSKGGMDFMTQQFTDASAKTKAAMDNIAANMQRTAADASQFTGDAARLGGVTAALQAVGMRQLGLGDNQDRMGTNQMAIAQRAADQTRVEAAQAADMQTTLDAAMRARMSGLDDQEKELMLRKIQSQIQEQQAARTAQIDQMTAESLAGDRAFKNNLAAEKLNLDIFKAKDASKYRRTMENIALAKLRKTGVADKDAALQRLTKMGIAARASAEAGWKREQEKNGKPFDGPTAIRSMNKAIQMTWQLLQANGTRQSPVDLLNVLAAIYDPAAIRRAGIR